MAAKEDDETSAWTFPKLTGPANWTDWSRSMKFALLALDLWGNVSGERVLPDENREPEKSDKWDTRDAKARGKIGLMCVTSIQMQLQSDWTAKETWDYLRRFCTPSGWSNKWELMSKVDHLSLAKCKDIADFMSQLTQLRNEVMDQKITIEDYFVIKAINSLGQRYETWVTYLAQQARDSQDGKLPSYKTIFENLQQEEHRQKQRAEQANFTRGGGNRGRGKGRGRGGGHQQVHNRYNHTRNKSTGGGRGYQGTRGRGCAGGNHSSNERRPLPEGACENCKCRHEDTECLRCGESSYGWRYCKKPRNRNNQERDSNSNSRSNNPSNRSNPPLPFKYQKVPMITGVQ